MIRLRLVLYGIVEVGNIVKTLDEAYVWRGGRWVRIGRKTLRRILANYWIIDGRWVSDNVYEVLLEGKKPRGVRPRPTPNPSGLE